MRRFCFVVKISVTTKVYQILATKTSLAYLVPIPLKAFDTASKPYLKLNKKDLHPKKLSGVFFYFRKVGKITVLEIIMQQSKSIKSAAKEAKLRLKNRFWEDYKKEVACSIKTAAEEGLAPSGVESYFKKLIVKNVLGASEEEEKFYCKVKDMLDAAKCRPHDALDRLMDKQLFASLSYEEKERYLFRLAKRYQEALIRYDGERGIEKAIGR